MGGKGKGLQKAKGGSLRKGKGIDSDEEKESRWIERKSKGGN